MEQEAQRSRTESRQRNLHPARFARGFVTIVISTLLLIVVCGVFAPSTISFGGLAGSMPFAALLAIVGLGQMLVVQQGGFDLSVPGAVSLAVVVSTHVPGGNNAELLNAVLVALGFALAAGIVNGILVAIVRLNPIIATIGMNALLYGAVFAVSGGVPRITTPLLSAIAGGDTFGIANSVYFALAALLLVSFVMKKTIVGRQFEANGANPLAARAVGLPVYLEMSAYISAQLLYCLAGILLGGITREPTAFLGNPLLLPSVAVVVLGGTSLLGGRGFPVSTVIAAFFLNQLNQFALSVGVPHSGQTIIQAFALGGGIALYSIRWTKEATKPPKLLNMEESNGVPVS